MPVGAHGKNTQFGVLIEIWGTEIFGIHIEKREGGKPPIERKSSSKKRAGFYTVRAKPSPGGEKQFRGLLIGIKS